MHTVVANRLGKSSELPGEELVSRREGKGTVPQLGFLYPAFSRETVFQHITVEMGNGAWHSACNKPT